MSFFRVIGLIAVWLIFSTSSTDFHVSISVLLNHLLLLLLQLLLLLLLLLLVLLLFLSLVRPLLLLVLLLGSKSDAPALGEKETKRRAGISLLLLSPAAVAPAPVAATVLLLRAHRAPLRLCCTHRGPPPRSCCSRGRCIVRENKEREIQRAGRPRQRGIVETQELLVAGSWLPKQQQGEVKRDK